MSLAVAGTLAVAIVPMFFAHPMGDDFCNAVHVEDLGILGAVQHEYLTWGGRWSSHFVAVGFPALFDLVGAYGVGLLTLLVFQIFSVWFLLTGVLPLGQDRRPAWAFTLVLVALYWAGLPHPGQSIYFLEGSWVYSLNLSLGMIILGCLLRLSGEASRGGLARILALATTALLMAAAHELFGLVLAGLLAVGAVVLGSMRDPRAKAWATCAVGAAVGVLTVAIAPGNEVRVGTMNPEGSRLGEMLTAALLMVIRILDAPVGRGDPMGSYSPLGWATDPRLLGATLLFLGSPLVRVMNPPWLADRAGLWKVVIPLTWGGALAGSLVAGAWALGRTLPLRAFNGLYWVFLAGWFLTLFVYSRPTGRTNGSGALYPVLRSLGAIVLALGLMVSSNFKHAVRDIVTGSLAGFDRSMSLRYEEVRGLRGIDGRVLEVEPFEPWPTSYFHNDLGDLRPELLECAAAFFEVESIRVLDAR